VTDPGGIPDDARRNRALDALVQAAIRAAAAERLAPPTGDEALRAMADAAAAAFEVTAISIALHDPATDRLVFRVAAGPEGPGVVGLSIGAHDGIAGYVHATGQALAVADAQADPRFERSTAERTGYVPRSLLAVPLVDTGGILGVMELLDRRDGAPFDLGDVEAATRMAAAVTAVARATRVERDATVLLRAVLRAVAGSEGEASAVAPGDDDVEALVDEIGQRLPDEDGLWRLAGRIGRLRDADPDDLDLAVAWLDALLERMPHRSAAGRRSMP
jgi:signal transduction protein with GAF and PtsI domain